MKILMMSKQEIKTCLEIFRGISHSVISKVKAIILLVSICLTRSWTMLLKEKEILKKAEHFQTKTLVFSY